MIFAFIAGIFGVVAGVLFLIMAGRYADRGLKLAEADERMEALQNQLDVSLAQQDKLRARIENLETIVTTEAWDALQERAQVDLPPHEMTDEEKAARLARRQRGV